MVASSPDPIALIAQSTVGEVGTEFLAALVRSMHAAMDVRIAFITRGVGEPPVRARAAYSWKKPDDKFPDEYDLEGTPCRLVYDGQHVLIPEQLWRQFPREVGCEGYCGIPLADDGGRVVGHFAVISETPISNPQRVLGIMRIFGMRVQAELRRLAREHERDVLIGRLTHAIDRLALQHQATRRANAFKTEALGMVAHDLRNPLAVIFGRVEYVEALLEQKDVAAQASLDALRQQLQKASRAIGQSAERMQRMIADLLASARSDATAISLNRAPIDLVMPVRVAIGLCHPKATDKAIAITEDLPDVGLIDADEDRVIEALENLIGNAVKFSPRDSAVSVTIRKDAAAGMAEVCVADQGQGLDEADLARVFQRYQTLSAKPTGGETSTGLGLAIVKAIADAHGGSIAAASEGKDKGTTFTLRLPLSVSGK
jgi:signal transduction histidine kinase